MNRILLKLAMLLMFILAGFSGWAALFMTFNAGVWTLILGILAIFFFFRALELVDKINKLGAYYEKPEDTQANKEQSLPKGPGQRAGHGEVNPEEEPDIQELPDEE